VLLSAIVEYIFSNYGNMDLIFSVPFKGNFMSLYSLYVHKTVFLEDICPV